MQQTYAVRHNEHSARRGFDEVVRTFEATGVGR